MSAKKTLHRFYWVLVLVWFYWATLYFTQQRFALLIYLQNYEYSQDVKALEIENS